MSELESDAVLARVRFDEAGLLPAVIQQYDSREVLMVGWMDAEALRRTLTEGRVTFWSRSRQEYWRKGDTSGHMQYVRGAALSCRSTRWGSRVTPGRARASTSTRSTPRSARQHEHDDA